MDWRQFLKALNVAYAEMAHGRIVRLLDTLNEILPIEGFAVDTGLGIDKYIVFADWLQRAKITGLITTGEWMNVRHILARHLF